MSIAFDDIKTFEDFSKLIYDLKRENTELKMKISKLEVTRIKLEEELHDKNVCND